MTSTKLKKRLLRNSRLYAVIDKKVCGRSPVSNTAKTLRDAGVGIVQFRDKYSHKEDILKDAYSISRVLSNSKTLFIINDYLDVAKLLNCDGVHLGQSDSSIEIARKIVGKDKIIGVSCHNPRQAVTAQNKGADYIGIGPIFATSTKPNTKPIGLDLIKILNKKIRIPYFAIGGIDQDNLKAVLSSGAKRVAVCKAVCRSRNIAETIRRFRERLNNQR